MISKKITIKLPTGLEARPVALLVQVASHYDSTIYVETENKRVNAKSIMGIFSIDLSQGAVIEYPDDAVELDAFVSTLS